MPYSMLDNSTDRTQRQETICPDGHLCHAGVAAAVAAAAQVNHGLIACEALLLVSHPCPWQSQELMPVQLHCAAAL